MIAGTELAALDHNHNANRKQATGQGEEEEVIFRYRIGWSKVFKKYTAKPVLQNKDYSYLKDITAKVLVRVDKGECGLENTVVPPQTLAPAEKPSREEVIEKRKLFARFK
ncbi:uncharacterized protein LOC116300461 [Actinia tenebrosa]|uniref:Uncharacterized protein LOC116300461 n=1 Tax=Actinia tenebrosa TaxID=6105 RepID=A0A6P8IAL4_ACTTE|nr:uncharacterized protein LOC116300461 [Actinia tenebrosa]